MLAMGDALAMALLQARDIKSEDFASLHPGGSLGARLLTKVKDIMRSGTDFAQVKEDVTVSETLSLMISCKSGAAVIVKSNGSLSGIFTHGDFVRAFQKINNISNLPVCELMTPNPITINGNELATEAVKVLQYNRIDELIVVDNDGRVSGLVDVQDLTRAKLF